MNKLFIVFMGALMGCAANSSATMIMYVDDAAFDEAISHRLKTESSVVVAENTAQPTTPQYFVRVDGLLFFLPRQGKKQFDDPRIKVIPVRTVTREKRLLP